MNPIRRVDFVRSILAPATECRVEFRIPNSSDSYYWSCIFDGYSARSEAGAIVNHTVEIPRLGQLTLLVNFLRHEVSVTLPGTSNTYTVRDSERTQDPIPDTYRARLEPSRWSYGYEDFFRPRNTPAPKQKGYWISMSGRTPKKPKLPDWW